MTGIAESRVRVLTFLKTCRAVRHHLIHGPVPVRGPGVADYWFKGSAKRPHIEDWSEEDDYIKMKKLGIWVCCPEEEGNRLGLKLWKKSLLLWLKETTVPSILQQEVDQEITRFGDSVVNST
ncbi:hypothetical protein TNCV_1689301 [Trichonephila clavipes]|nr:hypothetical protein TNCV_1689301 [Trichonephila clavipes]